MRQLVSSLVVFAAAALFAPPPGALAQGGSAGGSIGKQGKSVSGGEDQQPPRRAKAQPAPRAVAAPAAPVGRCDRIAGTWTWRWLNNSAGVVLRADGTGTATTGNTSTWICADGLVTIAWSNGGTDRLTLSSDGTRLSGNGAFGIAVTGTRN